MNGLHCEFFAAPADLLDCFSDVEKKCSVEYLFLPDPCKDGVFPRWQHADMVENLGIISSPSVSGSRRFLIGYQDSRWRFDKTRIERGKDVGKTYFSANQRDNPDTVYLVQGGVHSSHAIFAGSLATMGLTEKSRALYGELIRCFNTWPLESGYRVGKEARRLAQLGYRLVRHSLLQDLSNDVKLTILS